MIQSRSVWGALPPVRRYQIATPTPELWLHHTAGAGSDETAMRAIQNFHMAPPPIGRGWSDIAYSFLVDNDPPDVDIFEGRGAGIAGGHTKGRNTVSHAICVIGNFTTAPPKDETLEAVISLAVHGYRQGWWRAGFSGGHRDAPGANTSCPGDALHRLIPTLNAEIYRRIEGDTMGFTDLDGLPQEAVDAINRLTEQGILNGTSATTFDPYTPMTRAQVAMVIDRVVNPQ